MVVTVSSSWSATDCYPTHSYHSLEKAELHQGLRNLKHQSTLLCDPLSPPRGLSRSLGRWYLWPKTPGTSHLAGFQSRMHMGSFQGTHGCHLLPSGRFSQSQGMWHRVKSVSIVPGMDRKATANDQELPIVPHVRPWFGSFQHRKPIGRKGWLRCGSEWWRVVTKHKVPISDWRPSCHAVRLGFTCSRWYPTLLVPLLTIHRY